MSEFAAAGLAYEGLRSPTVVPYTDRAGRGGPSSASCLAGLKALDALIEALIEASYQQRPARIPRVPIIL